ALELWRRGPGRMERAASLVALAGRRQAVGALDSSRTLLREARRVIERCPDAAGLEARLVQVERRLPLAAGRRESDQPEALTGRELAVLRLLPRDQSLREVGAALFLSLNTIKTHTRGIYRKLEVATRAEAVSRAR